MHFWNNLPKPFFILAPMANVTDAAFRRIIAARGKPDVLFTEFVSCDGLCSMGKERLLPDLWYTQAERPIVAQIFGSNPAHITECATLIQGLGFDGLDINMGCPDKSVEKQGAGAALIKKPKLAQEIIAAAKKGAGTLPVSVKTRIGYQRDQLDEWLPALLDANPAAITIHARTRKEMSLVPAQWESVQRAVAMRDRARASTLIIGNGDVTTIEQGRRLAAETGADGIMIGRGIFANPWMFDHSPREITVEERLGAMVEHTRVFSEFFGGIKNFAIMKKHYKAYVTGFYGASELRTELMEQETADDVARVVDAFIASHLHI